MCTQCNDHTGYRGEGIYFTAAMGSLPALAEATCSPSAPCPQGLTHLHSSINGRIRAQAEVSPRHVVTDGGWDDTHDDAKLLILPPCLHQLQHPLIGLQEATGIEKEKLSG